MSPANSEQSSGNLNASYRAARNALEPSLKLWASLKTLRNTSGSLGTPSKSPGDTSKCFGDPDSVLGLRYCGEERGLFSAFITFLTTEESP